MDNADVFDLICRNIIAVLPDIDPQQITADRTLAQLGCNSIDRADIVTMTMQDLDISIPVAEFEAGRTIGGLADLMRSRV